MHCGVTRGLDAVDEGFSGLFHIVQRGLILPHWADRTRGQWEPERDDEAQQYERQAECSTHEWGISTCTHCYTRAKAFYGPISVLEPRV